MVGLGCLGLVGGGFVIWDFTSWKADRERLLVAASSILETRLGPVEYVDFGEGPVVLVLHGAPGGYDQAELIGRFLATGGFRVIAPSRPGYLRTPLAAGLLLEDQADLMNALLEELKIGRAAVLGVSVGGTVALEFAATYPQKTASVVLVSPITRRHLDQYNLPATSELIEERVLTDTTGDMGSWYASNLAERGETKLLSAVLDRDTDLDGGKKEKLARSVTEDPGRMEFFRDLVLSVAPLENRESGTRNDLLMMKALQPVDCSDVEAPILLVNGESRSSKEWTDPDLILKSAPNARGLQIPKVGRLVWLSPEVGEMNDEIAAFIGDAFAAEADRSGG